LCEHMAVTGWKILERVIRYAKGQNKRLRTLGIVPTMYDSRTVNSREMLKFMREQLSGRVNIFNTIIPRNVSVSEAPILEIDVLTYEPKSTGAQAFRKLTHEVLSAINSERR
nr:hypothetical protein [Nitrososphaeria archaeon]